MGINQIVQRDLVPYNDLETSQRRVNDLLSSNSFSFIKLPFEKAAKYFILTTFDQSKELGSLFKCDILTKIQRFSVIQNHLYTVHCFPGRIRQKQRSFRVGTAIVCGQIFRFQCQIHRPEFGYLAHKLTERPGKISANVPAFKKKQ